MMLGHRETLGKGLQHPEPRVLVHRGYSRLAISLLDVPRCRVINAWRVD